MRFIYGFGFEGAGAWALGGTVIGFFYQPLFYFLFIIIRREKCSGTYSTWLVSSAETVAAARSRLPFCVWTLDHTQIIDIVGRFRHLWNFKWRFHEFWLVVAGRKPHGMEPVVPILLCFPAADSYSFTVKHLLRKTK